MEQLENEYVFSEGRKGNRSHMLFYRRFGLRPAQEISHGRHRSQCVNFKFYSRINFVYLFSLLELLTPFLLSWTYGYTQQALSFQDAGLLICLLIFKILFPLPFICKYRLQQCDAENNYTSYIQWRLRLATLKQ